MGDFYNALKSLINYYSKDTYYNCPDYILADYLIKCLDNYKETYQAAQNSMIGDSHILHSTKGDNDSIL